MHCERGGGPRSPGEDNPPRGENLKEILVLQVEGSTMGQLPIWVKQFLATKPQEVNERNGLTLIQRPGKRKRFNDFRIATWNVLSLYRAGTLKMLSEEVFRYNIDIMAIQEVRWIGQGIKNKENFSIYYSCHPKNHVSGTGFIVTQKARKLVINFKALNPRICYLRLKGRFFNLSLFSVYAPTEVSTNEEKGQFYSQLEKEVDKCPQNDIKVILGDLNAQIGKEAVFSPTIGQHSLHQISNDNGLRLISFAASRGFVIGSTLFESKKIHKPTWKSRTGKTLNQIDHVLISSRQK